MEDCRVKTYLRWFAGLVFVTFSLIWISSSWKEFRLNPMKSETTTVTYLREELSTMTDRQNFVILWYKPPTYLKVRKDALTANFKECRYSNCIIDFDTKNAERSQAVIFDGRFMPERLPFVRPIGQIWIFAAHEAPRSYGAGGSWWYKNSNYTFNWTMTYNKNNTDIHLPYGDILQKDRFIERDFKALSANKTKTGIWIASHCPTHSKREEYVKELKKYLDIDAFGKCGEKWTCGRRYKHDQCFDVLNKTYKFYLAFENAFCQNYFTEKFYENWNYDLLMITRGGLRGDAQKLFPKGSYIAIENFENVEHLAEYIKSLSVDDYAQLLREKSRYYFPGYRAVYQRALCEICERLNNLKKYQKTIRNIKEWAYEPNRCVSPNDIV